MHGTATAQTIESRVVELLLGPFDKLQEQYFDIVGGKAMLFLRKKETASQFHSGFLISNEPIPRWSIKRDKIVKLHIFPLVGPHE